MSDPTQLDLIKSFLAAPAGGASPAEAIACGVNTMGDEHSRIRRIKAGDNDAIAEYLLEHKEMLLRTARRWIWHHGIDRADLDSEGAFDLAIGQLCELGDRGGLAWVKEEEDLLKLIFTQQRWVLKNQERQSRASKRDPSGDNMGSRAAGQSGDESLPHPRAHMRARRATIDLEQVASDEPPCEGSVDAELEIESLLDRLPDNASRQIVVLRWRGRTMEEIAHQLQVNRKTVWRKLSVIRKLYLRLLR